MENSEKEMTFDEAKEVLAQAVAKVSAIERELRAAKMEFYEARGRVRDLQAKKDAERLAR